MVNCYGSQYTDSLGYYEKIQKYIHSQANINCPGGLEGCLANPNDVRCKMGVKFGETSKGSTNIYKNLIVCLPALILQKICIYYFLQILLN